MLSNFCNLAFWFPINTKPKNYILYIHWKYFFSKYLIFFTLAFLIIIMSPLCLCSLTSVTILANIQEIFVNKALQLIHLLNIKWNNISIKFFSVLNPQQSSPSLASTRLLKSEIAVKCEITLDVLLFVVKWFNKCLNKSMLLWQHFFLRNSAHCCFVMHVVLKPTPSINKQQCPWSKIKTQ